MQTSFFVWLGAIFGYLAFVTFCLLAFLAQVECPSGYVAVPVIEAGLYCVQGFKKLPR